MSSTHVQEAAASMAGPKAFIPWQALPVTEAAALLRVSKWTIQRAINEGDLPSKKVRSKVRVDIYDLYDWFHSNDNEPGMPADPVLAALTA